MKNLRAARLGAALFIAAGAAASVQTFAAPAAHDPAKHKQEHKHEQKAAEPQKEQALEVVEAKFVCMINNQRFGREQFAVEAEGRTYYGCCEMCKDKLENDPQARAATDPVSGKKVDKATAVIGAAPDGRVFYFENEANLKKFKGAPKS